jgi:hypothetical protein
VTRDRIDLWLQRATYGVALLRVLRGESATTVVAETEAMVERAKKLRDQIEQQAPSSPTNGAAKNGE